MSRRNVFPSNATRSTPAYARRSASSSVGAYAESAMTRPPAVTICPLPFSEDLVPAWKATTSIHPTNHSIVHKRPATWRRQRGVEDALGGRAPMETGLPLA